LESVCLVYAKNASSSITFVQQGSLAGLEELAANGSMAPNGSMPAVNIPSFNNNATGYANPFDPSGSVTRGQQRRRGGKQVGLDLLLSLLYPNF
jgi:hypothetical protein